MKTPERLERARLAASEARQASYSERQERATVSSLRKAIGAGDIDGFKAKLKSSLAAGMSVDVVNESGKTLLMIGC